MSDLITMASADDLLPEIVKEHRAASEHMRHAVASAIKVGELLIQAKTLVGRGEWQDWLANNCPFAETTAQGYMRLARLPEENRNALRDSSLRAALDAIAHHHEKAIADESETIEGEAEEVEPSELDEVIEQRRDDTPLVPDEEEPGRSPEQKAQDIASEAIHDVIQQCNWKNVDHLLAFQTLIKLLTEEVKKTGVPLSAEKSAEARKAAYAATENEEPPPPKKQKPEDVADVTMPPPTDDPDYLRRGEAA